MTRRSAILGLALLLAGAGLIAVSLWEGSTHLFFVVIFPVLSGSSWLFGSSVGLVVLGILALSVSSLSAQGGTPAPSSEPGSDAPPPTSTGGFLLIGPIPILFGSAKGVSSRNYWLAVGAGTALCIAVVALLYLA